MPTPGEQKKVGIIPYDVRLTPGPVPTSGIFDEPTRPICINVQWIAHIDGVLERLVWEDAWHGEDSEIQFAIAEIRKLMKALALGNSCMSLNPLQVRQNTEQPCILESSSDLGETWNPFADILACVSSEFLEQSIIETINNSTELRDLINQSTQGLPDAPGDSAKANMPAFDTVPDCDKDIIYGYVFALWKYIDAKTVDFLEQMAELTNVSQQIDILLSLIPGFDATPVSSVLDWIGSFGDYNIEAYNSSKTVELEQEIICDLFCIAVDGGCALNFGDVYNYFIAKLGGLNAPTVVATFLEWVQFMAFGQYPNDRILYLWSAFQLALAFMGQEYLGQNSIERYALQAQSGNPDNDWDLLCEECSNAWSMSWLNGDGNPVPDGWTLEYGAYNATEDRIDSTMFSAASYVGRLTWEVPSGVEFDVTSVSMQYAIDSGSGQTRSQYVTLLDDTDTTIETTFVNVANGSGTLTLTPSSPVTMLEGYKILVNVACDSISGSWFARLNKLTVAGEGTNPFI